MQYSPIYISPERRMRVEPQSPQFKIEKDISIFFENIQVGHLEILQIFEEWKQKMRNKIFEIKPISNEKDLEKSLFGMSCDLMKKNQEIIEKTKESFTDNAKTMKLAFESLSLNVLIEKKTLEIQELQRKVSLLENKLQNEGGDLTMVYDQLSTTKEIRSLHQNLLEKNKLYEELYGESVRIQEKCQQLKKKMEDLSIENSNLKIKLVENNFRTESLEKQLKDLQIIEINLKNENQEKCEILINLETKLEMILNENEKLTGFLNEKLNIIEKLNFELESRKSNSEKEKKEVEFWKKKYEEKNKINSDHQEKALKNLEEKFAVLIKNNDKLTNEIEFLVSELDSKNAQVSFRESQNFTDRHELLEKLNIVINLNEHLNDIILINTEETNSLKEQQIKFEQREGIISSLLEENNELRTYFNKNFIDLEEKNLMKLIIQQNEQEIMLLKEEKDDLLRFKEIYLASEKIVKGENYSAKGKTPKGENQINNSYLR